MLFLFVLDLLQMDTFRMDTDKNFRSSHPEVFLEKVFWKYVANLQENTHAKVWFQ